MNTSELVAKIAEEHSVSKTQAQAIVDSMLKTILGAAANGEEISLPGFGKFKVKETPERDGRNPTSGEKIKIAAFAQTQLFACKGGEGPPERLSAGAKPRWLGILSAPVAKTHPLGAATTLYPSTLQATWTIRTVFLPPRGCVAKRPRERTSEQSGALLLS